MEAGTLTTYTQDYAAPLPMVLQAKTGTASTQYVYSLGTRPLAEYEAAAWEHLMPDPLGSVRQISDASGSVTLLKSYEPYGSVLNSQGSATSVFAYAGEQVDAYIKLVFLRARYYSPDTAMFLSKDTWQGNYIRPQSFNGWSYVEGNPVNDTDPAGLFSAVAWARSAGYSADLPGVLAWLESIRDHWSWAKMLLEAEESDFVYLWGRVPPWEIKPYGVFHCQDGKAHISLDRIQGPSGDYYIPVNNGKYVPGPLTIFRGVEQGARVGWRHQVGADLLSRRGLIHYRDGGDSGTMIDLPDFIVLGGVNLPLDVKGASPGVGPIMIDRYGNSYVSGGGGVGAIASVGVYGEGYISKGPFGGGGIIWTEDELKGALTFLSASITGFGGGIGGTGSWSYDFSSGTGFHAALIYTLGLGIGLGIGVGLTGEIPQLKNPGLSWDWMFHVPAPSRDSVWNQAMRSYTDNPCGECTVP